MKEYYGATPRDWKNRKRYTLLLAVWAAVYLVSTYLITTQLGDSPWRWLAAGTPLLFALVAAAAYWHFLINADELTRAIELKALALTVVAGFVVGHTMTLFASSGVDVVEEWNITVLAMVACYCYGQAKGARDYR
ncbi:MAG: hypothetical protein Q7W55_08675 [Pseudohongiella sp.]|nr:hypothetical protein [Pseudohongiella sp.]